MASTTTLTSLSSGKPEKKELCIICESQPYDLICTCGDKFDFTCIHQHVEQIGLEFQEQYQQVSEKIAKINDLQTRDNSNLDGPRASIDNWRHRRIQDINDIAERAINDIEQRENTFNDIPSFQQAYDQVSAELHRVVHENLNILIKLNRQIQNKIEDCQSLPTLAINENSLDASLQLKLNRPTSNGYESPTAAASFSSLSAATTNHHDSTTVQVQPVSSASKHVSFAPERASYTPEHASYTPEPALSAPERASYTPEPALSAPGPQHVEVTEQIKPTEPSVQLTNSNSTYDTMNDGANHDEFEAGQTRRIRRVQPIVIPTNNDKFAATICCHNEQLLYNDYDRTTQSSRLILIRDIANPTVKETIAWPQSDTTPYNVNDDEWVQDIIYSDKLSSYLVLNRARIFRLSDDQRDSDELSDFHTFTDRTMKRLACSEKYIYLTSSRNTAAQNGDEIILLNYEKEEQSIKTFRDVIPSRLNRGAGPLVGEISDIAVGANEQVTIGYRLERRNEVGVCLFNITNDGRTWSCVKQLLLNECWHSDLSYTPRLDWSDQLKVFVLIEYMTGHLIMIDRNGQVDGECRFMQVENRRESPINLSISSNDWFCVRYETSITIHKITP